MMCNSSTTSVVSCMDVFRMSGWIESNVKTFTWLCYFPLLPHHHYGVFSLLFLTKWQLSRPQSVFLLRGDAYLVGHTGRDSGKVDWWGNPLALKWGKGGRERASNREEGREKRRKRRLTWVQIITQFRHSVYASVYVRMCVYMRRGEEW